MRKKLFKTAAMIALFGFVMLCLPSVSNAQPKSSKFDFRLLIKKPVAWISSFVSTFIPIFDIGKNTPITLTPDNSSGKIKPLGDSLSVRPSKGD